MLKLPSRGLVGILILYLLLAVSYSVIVPIGRGADEWAHYGYAQFIATHHRLPLTVAERQTAGYKSDWPPLYHLAVASITAWVETDGPPTFKYREGHIRRQLIPAQGSEAILHTEDEAFPWQQEILIWHLGRFLSIAFSGLTLMVTYSLADKVFRHLKALNPTRLALIVTALLAFNPRFLFTGMLFNYDSLTLLLASLFFYQIIRVVIGYAPTPPHRLAWTTGLLAGLALMTKYLTILLPLEVLWSVYVSPGRRWVVRAGVAFFLTIAPWFIYLVVVFNEIDTYGPVLGSLAPLIRGDGSDRTVEELFAWLSGNQAPPPAFIERKAYTWAEIAAEFPLTFWTIPVTRPAPLAWFALVMSALVLVAALGLTRAPPPHRRVLGLLILHCLLPVPLMLVRLQGARDALEAMQGRHVLFLAGPAWVILWGYGLSYLFNSRWVFRLTLAMLLSGSLSQLIILYDTYGQPLPVTTLKPDLTSLHPLPHVSLESGASLLGYRLDEQAETLKATFVWQGGAQLASQDELTELQLVDSQGGVRAQWIGYQTQGRYPTRAWEEGDFVRDEAWLPLAGLSPHETYQVTARLGADWVNLGSYSPPSDCSVCEQTELAFWQNGQPVQRPFHERQTLQITRLPTSTGLYQLLDPLNQRHLPTLQGLDWATFIIEPAWPPGRYQLVETTTARHWDTPIEVAPTPRQFMTPTLAYPLAAHFEGQIQLLGYDLPTRKVSAGEGVSLTLYWQGLQYMGEDFVIFARLLDNQQVVWGQRDRLPLENYSTLLWAPQEIITDSFAIPIDPAAPAGLYHLHIGLYRRVAGQAKSLQLLDPQTSEPTEATFVALRPIKIGLFPAPDTQPQILQSQPFADQIRLLGYDWLNPPAATGTWRVRFYWQAMQEITQDYTLFFHVRDQNGQIVAQHDQPPPYPTTLWDKTETLSTDLSLTVEALPPAHYDIMIGFYDPITQLRLPVANSPDQSFLLSSFEVAP